MSGAFQSINQPQAGGVPQFQQTQPIVGTGGEAAMSAASLGASLFGQAAKYQQGKELAESKRATATALGGLQQKLLNIRQAAATDGSIDATSQMRIALTEFNVANPELREDASAAYKAETGTTPAGLDPKEKAQLESENESIKQGYGRFGATDEYNAEQHELRLNEERLDKTMSLKIKRMDLAAQEGKVNKSQVKATVMEGMRELGGAKFSKVASDSKNIIASVADGTMSQEEALLIVRNQRIALSREVASLGEFSTDPTVATYTKPLLDQLQLTEDIVTGKIEREAAKNIVDTNLSRAESIFFSDPKIVNAVTVSKAFNYIPGLTTRASNGALEFMSSGLTKEGMVPTRAKPMDVKLIEDEDVPTIVETFTKMSNDLAADKGTKEELANNMAGIAEHLNRNGMDYEEDDKKLAIKLLSTPNAMKLLSQEQKRTVFDAMTNYVIDDVDVAIRKMQSAPIITQRTFPVGVSKSRLDVPSIEDKTLNDVATLTIAGDQIFWEPKPESRLDVRAMSEIRKANKTVKEVVTPSVSIYSEVSGVGFEQMASSLFLPKQPEGVKPTEAPKEAVKK